MSKYFWIIFVLMGLWQFIGSIAERATKKQQDQRVSDLTAQRRRQQMAARRPAPGRTDRPQTGPVVVDRAGQLRGLLTTSDIIQFLTDQFPEDTVNLPPRLRQQYRSPGGA